LLRLDLCEASSRPNAGLQIRRSGSYSFTDPNNQLIVVTGAAGNQGGAAARHLLSKGWKVRALTRDVNKPAAQALAAAGAEVFRADNDDRASLDAAFKGAYGVFSVQNYWLPNVGGEGEVRQGKTVADAAKTAGVQHFVYSSVGATHRGMGQAHFATKHEIEQHIQSLGLPYTILRPVGFMENAYYTQAAISNGMYFGFGLRPDKKSQLIATDDIGAFAALVFARPQEFIGQTIELAGDELTESETAATLTQVIGRPVNVMPTQPQTDPEMRAMANFFNDVAYTADIAALRKIYPDMKTYAQWLRLTGWENLPVMEMPPARAERG